MINKQRHNFKSRGSSRPRSRKNGSSRHRRKLGGKKSSKRRRPGPKRHTMEVLSRDTSSRRCRALWRPTRRRKPTSRSGDWPGSHNERQLLSKQSATLQACAPCSKGRRSTIKPKGSSRSRTPSCRSRGWRARTSDSRGAMPKRGCKGRVAQGPEASTQPRASTRTRPASPCDRAGT